MTPEHPCSMCMSILMSFRRAPHESIMEGKRRNLASGYSLKVFFQIHACVERRNLIGITIKWQRFPF